MSFFPESSTQAHAGKNVVAETLQHPAPSQVAFKISGGNAMKAQQPLLEPTVIGFDVLDVIHTPHPDASGEVDRVVRHTEVPGDDGIG